MNMYMYVLLYPLNQPPNREVTVAGMSFWGGEGEGMI